MAASTRQGHSKYRNQRKPVAAPMVSLAVARKLSGKTLQDVCDHINREFQFEKRVERGTISAIENGHRGASVEMLVAIASALRITADDIDTQYVPRRGRSDGAVAV
ncbi:helix-turn-helix DNA-binding domain protein [Gordonia phage BoyNamedSue]|uniref:Helix-turn-helix DNA-binding domain protein n=1 Tax=Gordonia phage BoyNamedSue TaxID=2836009 RepID=A0A8F3E5S9_9CAUD|nr:helix-turn-helix DNA-binding domain protein [Gordonia phage BoyNamedSue]QWY79506.1 helix-turn-helix DNA-binding domain protein [Gordonia phage BoyNamedSue]